MILSQEYLRDYYNSLPESTKQDIEARVNGYNPDLDEPLAESSVLQEAYIGKTKELLAIEAQLDKYRKKYSGSFNVFNNTDPDLLKFNRMVEDYFGFGTFCLKVIPEAQVNAYTAPVSIRIDAAYKYLGRRDVIVDAKHFRFKKDCDYAGFVVVSQYVMFNPDITTPEVMGIILHEVGHNFYASLNGSYGVMSFVYSILAVVAMIYSFFITMDPRQLEQLPFLSNWLMKIDNKLDQCLRQNKFFMMYMLDIFSTFSAIAKTIIGAGWKIIDFLTLGLINLFFTAYSTIATVFNPFTYVFLYKGYTDERAADNFATVYGYGAELSSGLNKMQQIPSNIDKIFVRIPVFGTLYTINNDITSILAHSVDVHPRTIARINDQIRMLEREIVKDDCDPKMKKVMLADIKECKKQIDFITKANENLGSNRHIVDKAYNQYIQDKFGGDSMKDILFSFANDKRYRSFDNIMKKS